MDWTGTIKSSLESIGIFILNFYRQKPQAFSTNESTNFMKFCSCFAYLIPYLHRCLHVVLEPAAVTCYLVINEMTLLKAGITFFKPKQILWNRFNIHYRTKSRLSCKTVKRRCSRKMCNKEIEQREISCKFFSQTR